MPFPLGITHRFDSREVISKMLTGESIAELRAR
jgi:hypothetical protein